MHQGLHLTILGTHLHLFFNEIFGDPQKGGYGIVNCNLRCTCCPLVPKRVTFYDSDGSPMLQMLPQKSLPSPSSVFSYALSVPTKNLIGYELWNIQMLV